MRNRAKCRLCGDIIESFVDGDYTLCRCGEIAIDGGLYRLKAYAKDWSNFIRIDVEGEEIIPKIVEKVIGLPAKLEAKIDALEQSVVGDDESDNKIKINPEFDKEFYLQQLVDSIKRYDTLPNQYAYVTETDLNYLRVLLLAIFRSS